MKISMQDLRALGYCSIGVRRVCRVKDINFKKLLSEGLTMEELELKLADTQHLKEIKERYERR